MTADPGDRTPPAPPTGTSPTLRAERSLLQRAASDPEALLAALLRSKSVRGRVLAAHLVAAGADPRTLESLGRAVLDPAGAERALAELRALGADAEGLATYAWLCAIQTGAPQDTDAAMGLFEAAHTLSGGEQPAGRRAGVWTQLLVLAGRDERARDLLGTDRGSPEANAWAGVDLLNPHRAVPGHPAPRPGAADRAAVDAWLAAFNEQVTCHGIAPLRLADPSELFADGWLEQFGLRREEMFHTPFDHLATAPVEPVHDPFRVSIVMSTFNGGHELLLAARAIVAQSWQNWELFVVDDASPEPVPGVLEAVEALDPRITVVRKAVNGGTYRCRNTALRLATGDAFTVVDSDDWAHPQQLETLVGALVADPALVAAQANCLRIGEDLRVTRPGYTGRIMSRANLTVRMVPGVSRVGFFDPVRKAADTEYAQRLEAAFGVPPLRHPAPLTFLRTSDDSLSAGDFSPGWHHGSRAEYRAAFTPWHDRINQGLADPFFDDRGPRPFPAPDAWLSPTPRPRRPRRHLDVVLAADWHGTGPAQREAADRLEALVGSARQVGILALENVGHLRRQQPPLHPTVQRALTDGSVEMVQLDGREQVDLLAVLAPRAMLFPPQVGQALAPRRVVLVGDPGDIRAEAGGPEVVEGATRSLFGATPAWITWPALEREVRVQTDTPTGTLPEAPSGEVLLEAGQGTWVHPGPGSRTVRLRRPADATRHDLLVLWGDEDAVDDVLDEVLALVDRDASDTSVLEAAMTSPAVSAIALRRGTTWVLVGPVDGAPRSTAGARRFSVHPGGPLRAHTWRDHRGARVEPVPVSPPPTGSLSGEPSA